MFGIPKAWLMLAAALAAVAFISAVYVKADNAGYQRCEVRKQAEIIAEVGRRTAVIEAELAAERARADAATADNADLQKKVDDYETELASRADVCLVFPADAERLRNIR